MNILFTCKEELLEETSVGRGDQLLLLTFVSQLWSFCGLVVSFGLLLVKPTKNTQEHGKHVSISTNGMEIDLQIHPLPLNSIFSYRLINFSEINYICIKVAWSSKYLFALKNMPYST